MTMASSRGSFCILLNRARRKGQHLHIQTRMADEPWAWNAVRRGANVGGIRGAGACRVVFFPG